MIVILKRSSDPGPGEGGTTPEGSLTLVSVVVVVNIGLEILGNLTKLNIELKLIILSWNIELNIAEINIVLKNIELNNLVNFSIERTSKKNTTIIINLQKLLYIKIVH